jgi:hypothetical protein
MFHTPWCELDLSCLKCLKQVRLGVKKFCWCENKFSWKSDLFSYQKYRFSHQSVELNPYFFLMIQTHTHTHTNKHTQHTRTHHCRLESPGGVRVVDKGVRAAAPLKKSHKNARVGVDSNEVGLYNNRVCVLVHVRYVPLCTHSQKSPLQ